LAIKAHKNKVEQSSFNFHGIKGDSLTVETGSSDGWYVDTETALYTVRFQPTYICRPHVTATRHALSRSSHKIDHVM
jgi:hypothetical protein